MHFIRNPEVRWVLFPDLLIAVLSGAWMYRLAQSESADPEQIMLIASGTFCVMLLVFLIVSALHSGRVRRFTQRIEKNLHGHQDLQFDDFREGDFSVLQSTVINMVNAHFQQESLLQAEKTRLADELANIAHQIKTPLSAICLNAEQLADADMQPMQRRMAVHRTVDLVERIRVFVTTLLKLSRLDANVARFRNDTFSVQTLVDDALAPLEISMDLRNQTLVRDTPSEIMIEGDRVWMTEALLNVIKNCMEHTPEDGTISISATSNAILTCITVCDTGTGIAPDDLPHIFERYHKGKDSGANSIGIGLAFSRSVFHEMGGTIHAENLPEGGAKFTINLFKVNV